MRLAAAQVGRGASASTFGDVARAASDEAGAHNLSSGLRLCAVMCTPDLRAMPIGTRWAAGVAVGKNKKNAERDVNAALQRSDGVPSPTINSI